MKLHTMTGNVPIMLDRADKATIPVQETDDFETSLNGIRVTLFREGLLFEGTTTAPCHFHMLVGLNTLLKAWHTQNERIGH